MKRNNTHKTSQVEPKAGKITLTTEKGFDIIGNNKKSFSFQKNEFNINTLHTFSTLFAKRVGLFHSNDALAVIMSEIRGKWLIDDFLTKFVEQYDKIKTCEMWRGIFQLSLDTLNLKNPVVGEYEGIPLITSKNDVGQVVATIGWYCYGFAAGAAWDAFETVMATFNVPVCEMLEPVKFVIDFTSDALNNQRCIIGRTVASPYFDFFWPKLEAMFGVKPTVHLSASEIYDFPKMRRYMNE